MSSRVLQIHLSTLIISFNGLFAKLIHMPSAHIIAARTLVASLALTVFFLIAKKKIPLPEKKDLKIVLLIGLIMTVHWVAFFWSIQLSNVAIGLISFFSYPLMTALIEPVLGKSKFHPMDLFKGACVMAGIYVMHPNLSFTNDKTWGVIVGLFAAFSYAIRNTLTKNIGGKYSSLELMYYQVAIVAMVLMPIYWIKPEAPSSREVWLILVLALFFTLVGHTLYIQCLKYFSAKTVSLINGLQAVYAIVAAIFILGEIPSINVLLGGSIILFVVLWESLQIRIKS